MGEEECEAEAASPEGQREGRDGRGEEGAEWRETGRAGEEVGDPLAWGRGGGDGVGVWVELVS